MKSIRNQKNSIDCYFSLKMSEATTHHEEDCDAEYKFRFFHFLTSVRSCLSSYILLCCHHLDWSSIKHLKSRLIVNQAPLCIVSPSTHRFNILEPVRSFCHCALAFSFSLAGWQDVVSQANASKPSQQWWLVTMAAKSYLLVSNLRLEMETDDVEPTDWCHFCVY